ncbi:uroporphyrinogen decarboxylase [Pseudactinotalea sp. HY160]|uniref:uroporphyrinogen decarboxylase n=1 Tax=Pseudactinotalea sp. HY160 TaxID=2654490 RepID=UPI001311B45D|nr:uroporphyrinogen decarboxylase [Pseudactinotalea sp. HY160]
MHTPTIHPLEGATALAPLIEAYRGRRPDRLPVWFMRQAGRSLPEYRAARAARADIGMLEACLDPALATEITLQPVRRHGVDAAILFSDIVIPLRLAGVEVDIAPGVGPVFAEPIRDRRGIEELVARPIEEGMFAPVTEAVRLLTAELGPIPLIGFAGAPFTLAAYMVEGRPSRDHLAARTLMHADPGLWRALADWTARLSGAFLLAQARAGASAVQLFDSWAGSLPAPDYRRLVAPASRLALAPVREARIAGGTVPTVHFGVGTAHLLPDLAGVGADVLGVDHRLSLTDAARAVPGVPLQGNIDPALLGAPWPVLAEHVHRVIEDGARAPGHVLNLGHGVPPATDPGVLTRIVDLAHA